MDNFQCKRITPIIVNYKKKYFEKTKTKLRRKYF